MEEALVMAMFFCTDGVKSSQALVLVVRVQAAGLVEPGNGDDGSANFGAGDVVSADDGAGVRGGDSEGWEKHCWRRGGSAGGVRGGDAVGGDDRVEIRPVGVRSEGIAGKMLVFERTNPGFEGDIFVSIYLRD